MTGSELSTVPVTVWRGGYGDRHPVQSTAGAILCGCLDPRHESLDAIASHPHPAGIARARAAGAWTANMLDHHAAYVAIADALARAALSPEPDAGETAR